MKFQRFDDRFLRLERSPDGSSRLELGGGFSSFAGILIRCATWTVIFTIVLVAVWLGLPLEKINWLARMAWL